MGVVENMSYFECDDCGKKHYIYGNSHIEEIAEKYNLEVLGKLPIDPKLANLCDNGDIENLDNEYLINLTNKIENWGK